MIRKDKKIICDSCHKEILVDVNTVNTNGKGWSLKANHFHPTPLDCAEAVEPIKIYKARSMNQREDN